MGDITTTLLTYLIHNRIIDENSAAKIKEETKQNNHKVLGEILLENNFFTKEDLLILVIEFFKKGYNCNRFKSVHICLYINIVVVHLQEI